MKRVATGWGSLRKRLWEHRGELALSLRVTTAAVSSFALSYLLHIPLPLWTVLTAVILTQASFGQSLKATFEYLVGTLLGAAYAGILAALVPHDNDVALAGVMALAVAPLALLARLNPAFRVATFTGVLVLLIPGTTHVGPIESALYRVLEVAVGGLTALGVSLLVFPARAHALAIEGAAELLDLMARSLSELVSGLTHSCDASAIRRIQDGIGRAFGQLDAVGAEARVERIGFLAAEPGLGPLLRTLLRLRHDFVMVGRAAAVPLPEAFQARLGPRLAQVATTAAEYLRRSGEALRGRRDPPPLEPAEAALAGCAEAFEAVRRDGLTRDLPVDTVERIFALGFTLDQLLQNFRDLQRCVRDAARSP
ncbi:MAG: FUSC family protein [Xanthobacteraceae bacterium]